MKHAEIPEQEVARYWDENANLWADHVRQGWDAYREHFNNPAFFKFVGDLSGKTVLDAGCGEGYNTRLLARSGARMTKDIEEPQPSQEMCEKYPWLQRWRDHAAIFLYVRAVKRG